MTPFGRFEDSPRLPSCCSARSTPLKHARPLVVSNVLRLVYSFWSPPLSRKDPDHAHRASRKAYGFYLFSPKLTWPAGRGLPIQDRPFPVLTLSFSFPCSTSPEGYFSSSLWSAPDSFFSGCHSSRPRAGVCFPPVGSFSPLFFSEAFAPNMASPAFPDF